MTNAALSFDAEASALLDQLCTALSAKTGLALTRAHWGEVRRAIAAIADDMQCADWMSCLRLLASPEGTAHQQALIDRLTIGETYFFRDGALFALLRERLLPELIGARRDRGNYVRIWSAGCCSGEEPYSIAIELLRQLPDWRNWSITLLATDINRRFLQKAERGIYERWSLRHKPLAPYAPYLLPLAKGRFEVAPLVRDLIAFAHLNLATHLYPSPLTNTQNMDIVLCRNVLMYLRPDCIRDVIARLSGCLAEGGWLITSTIEASLVQRPELHAVRLPDIVLFRKRTSSPVSLSSTPGALLGINEIAPSRHVTNACWQRGIATEKNNEVARAENRVRSRMPAAERINPADQPIDALVLKDWMNEARALADRGLLSAACAQCEKILAVDKLNAEANFLRAAILLELGDSEGAEKGWQRTLYLDEAHIVAHVALATLLQQSNRRADAQRHWRSAQQRLRALPSDDVVRDSDGLSAKQMLDMVNTMLTDN